MKSLKVAIAATLGVGACFLFGFSWRDVQHGEVPSAKSLQALFGVKDLSTLTPEQSFRQAYSRILGTYIRPVKPVELKYAGMQGLMSSLGDPHTMFLAPRIAQEFSDQTRANFGGVGAKLQPDPLGARISSVFEDGPAYASGLRGGDVIIAVNGVSVGSKPLEGIVEKIKGPEGTKVKLTAMRKGHDKPLIFNIKRAKIITPTVESKYFPDSKVGWVAIGSFAEPTAAQFDKEINKLEQKNIKGLVIDLRGNPGGLLGTAVDMLSRFVENKVVVTMKFRDGREEAARTYPGSLHQYNYPIVALINEDSASAAEIFSGCLRDYGRATLVGTHSYGKASVQNVIPLVDTSSAKITIARYYLPMGSYIGRKVDEDGVYQSGGLEPSVKVDLDLDADPVMGEPKTDNQLRKAIEVVLAKK